MRGQKGITLIALIITIIVLLILAIVTIGAVENSNIINYAQNASSSHKEGAEEEQRELNKAENLIKDAISGKK